MSRKIKVELTEFELHQILWCIGQMTDGNARDLDEMVLCGMTTRQALGLCRAEAILRDAKKSSQAHEG